MRASSLLLFVVVGPVFGQEVANEPSTAVATDEIIVRGETPQALRLEIERAEDAIFERFNEINSHDDFDIRCTLETLTGTHIPQRVCAPVFLRKAQARAGRDAVLSFQGSAFGGGSGQFYAGLASYRYRQLEDEMDRLARRDEQFAAALRGLLELRELSEQPASAGRER